MLIPLGGQVGRGGRRECELHGCLFLADALLQLETFGVADINLLLQLGLAEVGDFIKGRLTVFDHGIHHPPDSHLEFADTAHHPRPLSSHELSDVLVDSVEVEIHFLFVANNSCEIFILCTSRQLAVRVGGMINSKASHISMEGGFGPSLRCAPVEDGGGAVHAGGAVRLVRV